MTSTQLLLHLGAVLSVLAAALFAVAGTVLTLVDADDLARPAPARPRGDVTRPARLALAARP